MIYIYIYIILIVSRGVGGNRGLFVLTREPQPTWEEHGVGTLLSRLGWEISNIIGLRMVQLKVGMSMIY